MKVGKVDHRPQPSAQWPHLRSDWMVSHALPLPRGSTLERLHPPETSFRWELYNNIAAKRALERQKKPN